MIVAHDRGKRYMAESSEASGAWRGESGGVRGEIRRVTERPDCCGEARGEWWERRKVAWGERREARARGGSETDDDVHCLLTCCCHFSSRLPGLLMVFVASDGF